MSIYVNKVIFVNRFVTKSIIKLNYYGISKIYFSLKKAGTGYVEYNNNKRMI